MSPALGSLDGRVELRGLLGEGGMGEVHRAWDRSLERAVAVKFVRGQDPRDAERLLLEARLQARVEHPHVVKVHEVGTLGERPCIVFQLVEGRTLADLAPRLPVAARVDLMLQAATGIHAAHLQGLVHRDVKPANVLVEEGEGGSRTALVTDFGLARGEEAGLTRTGLPPGTLDYMSPEQLVGPGPVDFRSDVYALGATLYAVLAGRAPFRTPTPGPRRAEDDMQVVRRILEEEPAPLPRLMPEVARELAVIAAMAMEKEPAARYPSAEAFAEDLSRFQRGEPIRARPATASERILKWSRRNRLATRALAAAALSLLLGGGVALWVSRQAGVEALEAARLGAEAQEMQEIMRTEMLLPPHDLTPAYDRIRGMMASVTGRPAAIAPGAAAFTLGRGHQLLGDVPGAYRELSRAWDLGFRRPQVARALGETEGQLYAQELLTLGKGADSPRRQARKEELARRYLDPAVARLRGLPAATEADRLHVAARLALVERKFDEAAETARRAAGAGADPLEAGETEGRALLDGAWATYEQRDLAGTATRAAATVAALERTVAVGRSAPAPRLLLARARLLEYRVETHRLGLRVEPLDAIAALLRETEMLHHENSELRVVWSAVEVARSEALAAAGEDPTEALRAAVDQGERAVRAAADPRQPLLQLANASCSLAVRVAETGGDPRPVLERGVAAAERAQELAPDSSGPPFNLAYLRIFRAQWLSAHGMDARAEARAALADARRMLELGGRPVMARLMVGEALEALAVSEWLTGGEVDALLSDGLGVLEEATRMAPEDSGARASGLQIAGTWAELALAESRIAEAAFRAGLPWAESALPLAEGNLVQAALVGRFYVLRARAALQGSGDPSPWLDRAVPLLDRAVRGGHAAAMLTLGEAELTRAAWAAVRGDDPRPALARAESHARRRQVIDSTDAEAALLEARALAAAPRPTAPALARARAALARSLDLGGRRPVAWLVDARVRRAQGDLAGARESLERAAALQPRLGGLADLRAALKPRP